LQPQKLKEGDVVLIDGGCGWKLRSDVTRTGVYGKPSEKCRGPLSWLRNHKTRADAAVPVVFRHGRRCRARVIVNGGYGPDYNFHAPDSATALASMGTSIHILFVRANRALNRHDVFKRAGIYIPGEFGIRCEDDMVITA